MVGYCSSTVQGIGGWLIYLALPQRTAGFDPFPTDNLVNMQPESSHSGHAAADLERSVSVMKSGRSNFKAADLCNIPRRTDAIVKISEVSPRVLAESRPPWIFQSFVIFGPM